MAPWLQKGKSQDSQPSNLMPRAFVDDHVAPKRRQLNWRVSFACLACGQQT